VAFAEILPVKLRFERRGLTVTKVEVEKEGIFEMLYPAPVILVTSVDGEGRPNIITLAWAMPTSYDPPMVALAVRPERYSYGLIKEAGEFVVNVPTRGLLGAVMACGTTSGRTVDKFRQAGLTPSPAKRVKPPIIEECIAHLECRLVDEVPTGSHRLLIGLVVAAYADEKAFTGLRYNVETTQLLLALQDGPHTFTTPRGIVHPPTA